MIFSLPMQKRKADLPKLCLSEIENPAEAIENKVTHREYQRIEINDAQLTDNDLLMLIKKISYLEYLSIADTEITGTCLFAVLHIKGLKELNIGHTKSATAETVKTLCECLPKTATLEKLD